MVAAPRLALELAGLVGLAAAQPATPAATQVFLPVVAALRKRVAVVAVAVILPRVHLVPWRTAVPAAAVSWAVAAAVAACSVEGEVVAVTQLVYQLLAVVAAPD